MEECDSSAHRQLQVVEVSCEKNEKVINQGQGSSVEGHIVHSGHNHHVSDPEDGKLVFPGEGSNNMVGKTQDDMPLIVEPQYTAIARTKEGHVDVEMELENLKQCSASSRHGVLSTDGDSAALKDNDQIIDANKSQALSWKMRVMPPWTYNLNRLMRRSWVMRNYFSRLVNVPLPIKVQSIAMHFSQVFGYLQ